MKAPVAQRTSIPTTPRGRGSPGDRSGKGGGGSSDCPTTLLGTPPLLRVSERVPTRTHGPTASLVRQGVSARGGAGNAVLSTASLRYRGMRRG